LNYFEDEINELEVSTEFLSV
jgi:hypothetical protein